MTITLDEDVYEGLRRRVEPRRISQFVSDILRPHVSDASLDGGYRAMAQDAEREAEAQEWISALANDGVDAAR
ncbi:hypothetical protein [Sphingomonas sp.]|uniref:hypothetical protein n=1 Tax=Sphingomonas sp. TaxID=28214 RepID=UPI0035C7C187